KKIYSLSSSPPALRPLARLNRGGAPISIWRAEQGRRGDPGYFRIIINFIAFAVCYSNRVLFAILYFFSFFCDGLDGWFA
ncbi:Os06g0492000, partial [Oryza sativa Japonica Group]